MTAWGPLLRRCLVGGVGIAAVFAGEFLFFWLLYRLVKALQWRRKPPEERAAWKRRREHPLSGASGQARTAYLLRCLENALRRFGLEGWEPVLERFGTLTAARKEVGFPQLFRVCAVLPVNILPYARLEDLELDLQREDLTDFFDGKPGVTEEEFQYLRTLYQDAGWRLCVLDPLLQAVYKTSAASLVDGREEFDRLVMDLIEQSERLLEGWGIPLPEVPA